MKTANNKNRRSNKARLQDYPAISKKYQLVYQYPSPLFAYSIYRADKHDGTVYTIFKQYTDNTGRKVRETFFTSEDIQDCYDYMEPIRRNKLYSQHYGYGLTMTRSSQRKNIITTNQITTPNKGDYKKAKVRNQKAYIEEKSMPDTYTPDTTIHDTTVSIGVDINSKMSKLRLSVKKAEQERIARNEAIKAEKIRQAKQAKKAYDKKRSELADVFAAYGYSV